MLRQKMYGEVFGMPMARERSVFIPKESDTELFKETMKIKAQYDVMHMALKAKRQKVRAGLPEAVRDFYNEFEAKIENRADSVLGCALGRV